MSARYLRVEARVPGVVEHAWVVRHDAPTTEVLVPDGRGLLQVVVGPAGTLRDVLTGVERPDVTGLRGLATHAALRVHGDAVVRVGVQLHPLATTRLGQGPLADAWRPAEGLVGDEVLAAVASDVAVGEDQRAASRLVDALAAWPRTESDDLGRLGEVLRVVDEREGRVSAGELARAVEATVSDLYRWAARFLGVELGRYLAAIRFTVLVREAVGRGTHDVGQVADVLRWYVQAGHPPREVERLTGLAPAELRRVLDRLTDVVAPAR